MKKKFKAYTPITKKQIDAVWRSKTTLFILDTNILLNLYSYRKKTQDDFFKILEKLKSNIWIPYHVMLEYHRNRLKVINDKENTINEIIKRCNDMRLEFPNDMFEKKEEKDISSACKDFSRKYPDLKTDWNNIKEVINKDFSKKKEEYIKKIKQVTDNDVGINNHDKIYDSLMEILKFVGTAYDKGFIEDIKNKGKERYKHKRPPGYKDATKDQSEDNVYYHNGCAIPYKYGDLIIWEEIKRYVKNEKAKLFEIKNIVFVTDDNKEDWVQKHYSGDKTISVARYELFDELLMDAKHISHFLIADSESFVEQSNNTFNLELNDDSVNDIKNTANNLKRLILERAAFEISNSRSEKKPDSLDSEDFKPPSNPENTKLSFFQRERFNLMQSIKATKRDIRVTEMLLLEPRSREDEIRYRRRLLRLEEQLLYYSKQLDDLVEFYIPTKVRPKEE
ncbi:PIN-like domain-containing protein [Gilliamella sp. Occ4-3]|uniref:PIN-like domain-containing protein n=1 Tax=Gilliamella sp. Occ4-3 TaxID=3120254 RepID=UPI00080DB4EC|nr:PIN-like domain-containing protein [Gilliamella apicola]OCG79370.1 hypothetical protein A9G44_11600 [Gilliamella apicola]